MSVTARVLLEVFDDKVANRPSDRMTEDGSMECEDRATVTCVSPVVEKEKVAILSDSDWWIPRITDS